MAMWRPASACGVDRSSFYSDFYMAKQVSLNPVVDGESFPKVIEFKSSLHIGEVHQRVFFEAPALYGKKTLSVAYEVDPESGQIYRRGVCSTTQAGCQTGSSRPVIFATPDGSLAMAQFAPDLPADAQKYTAEIVLSPTRHDLPQSKLATIYSYGAPTVGDYSTRTFAAFGTLAEVTGSVVRLARHFSKTGKPAGISESDIRSQYQFFFGRAPTDVELNGWLQVAANTTLTQLINALKCAEETYAYLYQSVLGRGIEPDVLQMRVNQCRSGEKDYADQAREIRCATERFDQEYVRVLDRHIDEGAAANATNLCLNNQLTVLNLRASLVISDEATSLISRVVGLRFGEGVALAQLVNAIRSALLQTNGVSIAGIADQLTITQNIWRETFELTRLETNEATANALADAIAYYSQGGTYALYRQLLTMSSAIRYGFLLQAVRAVSMSVFNTISQNTDHVERVLTWVGLHSLREYKDLLYYAKGIWVNRLGLTTVNNSNYDKIENAVDAMMFDQTPEQYCAVTVQNPEVRRLYAIPAIRQVWRSVLGFVPQSDATMNRSVTALCEGKDLAEQTLILQSINREWRTVCGRSPSETGRPDAVLWYDAAVPAVLDGSITWAQYRKAIAPSCYWVR